MARIAQQVKNVATILLTAVVGPAFGYAQKGLENGRWKIPAGVFAAAILGQISLVFVESKEEAELSKLKKRDEAREQQIIDLQASISLRMQKEIEAGNLSAVKDWNEIMRTL